MEPSDDGGFAHVEARAIVRGPAACRGPPWFGGGTFLSAPRAPSAVHGLLASQVPKLEPYLEVPPLVQMICVRQVSISSLSPLKHLDPNAMSKIRWNE